MLLMSCKGLTRAFDRGTLFENLSFELYHGERVGIVGPNGVGKTTLMKILAGEDQPDRGEVQLHAGARSVLLRQQANFSSDQTLFAEAKSAFNRLLEAQDELVRVADEISHTTDPILLKSLSARFDRLTELLHHQDAYTLDHRIEEVLCGLGFKPEDYDRPVVSFSGGQQRRLLLAILLLSSPDIMLLDEPSNHLDIETTRWLESYLAQQSQAMFIVSHDRYFLNKVVTKIFELSPQRMVSYPGNFDQYVKLRQERFEQEQKTYLAQKEYIEKQEEIIRRVHYGQLAKMAQSRQKALDKLEVVEAPVMITAPKMQFEKVIRAGDIIIQAEDISKSFGDKELFKNLSFTLERGKKLGIIGPNGVGKTTLLKIILGQEDATSGKLTHGQLLEFGYLDQHLHKLDENKSVIRAIWPEPDPSLTEQRMRDLLGRFGLAGKIVEQPVRELSGGERSRAALASLVVQGANVLILDEPTNHLDIWASEALEEALKEFDGTVIVVSHDRYFLNRIIDLLIVLEPGRTEVVYGNYSTYELLREARLLAQKEEKLGKPQKNQKSDKKGDKISSDSMGEKNSSSELINPSNSGTNKPPKRKRRFPYRKVADIEKEIAEKEELAAKLEGDMVDPEIYRNHVKLNETMNLLEDTKNQIAQLYEHWEEASELN